MNPLRSPKSTYVAAFLLGGLIALLLAHPSRAAEPFRLNTSAFDAATLIILPPGAYTVHVGTSLMNVRDGDVLVEGYSVPEDVFD